MYIETHLVSTMRTLHISLQYNPWPFQPSFLHSRRVYKSLPAQKERFLHSLTKHWEPTSWWRESNVLFFSLFSSALSCLIFSNTSVWFLIFPKSSCRAESDAVLRRLSFVCSKGIVGRPGGARNALVVPGRTLVTCLMWPHWVNSRSSLSARHNNFGIFSFTTAHKNWSI